MTEKAIEEAVISLSCWSFIQNMLEKCDENKPLPFAYYEKWFVMFQQGIRDKYHDAERDPKDPKNALVLVKWAAYLAEMKDDIDKGINAFNKWQSLNGVICND